MEYPSKCELRREEALPFGLGVSIQVGGTGQNYSSWTER